MYIYQIIIIFGFIIQQYLLYLNVTSHNPQLKSKQRAYILSIQASIVIFLISLYYFYKFIICNFDTSKYLQNITYDENNLAILTILYLISYLVSDTLIGTFEYRRHLGNLAGYPHHIFYNILCYYILKWEYSSVFMLFLVAELPTIILGIGSYDNDYRNDPLYGIVFFITRIFIHLFFIYLFRYNYTLVIIGSLILPLHIYWFYNWSKKYLCRYFN